MPSLLRRRFALLPVLALAALGGPVEPANGAFDHPSVWAALGDSYSSGEGIPGAKGACQRADHQGTNATAWAVGAYEGLRADIAFEQQSLVACTGAIADDVTDQLAEAERHLSRPRFEIVSFTFGGNSIGFADALYGCLDLDNLPWGVFKPGCDLSEAEMRSRVDMLAGNVPIDPSVYKGSVALPELYDRVAAKVEAGGDVLVLGYPHLIEESARWPWWQRHTVPFCQGIGITDTALLRSVTGYLNQQTALAVEAADRRHREEGVRFHFVDVSRDPYESSGDPDDRHGLCSHDQWLNGITTGITSLHPRINRSFHPTQEGHTNTARVVERYVRESVRLDDAPQFGWQLDSGGIGPIRLGMTEAEARGVGIDVEVTPGPFCDSWFVNGLYGITLAVPHSSGELASVSLLPDGPVGHGAGGIEIGDDVASLVQRFGDRLDHLKGLPGLDYAFYRVSRSGSSTVVQFTVDTGTDRVLFEEAGFPGQFYYPDGNELCA